MTPLKRGMADGAPWAVLGMIIIKGRKHKGVWHEHYCRQYVLRVLLCGLCYVVCYVCSICLVLNTTSCFYFIFLVLLAST